MFGNKRQTVFLMATAILSSACSKNFVVTGDIPTPLVPRSQAAVLMQYSDDFKTYEFTEKAKDRPLERVAIGPAQVSLFNQIFGSLFVLADSSTQLVDLKIEPQIIDLQYSAPRETKLNLYEVWLKYRLKVTDTQNDEVADWVVKGYGKTPTATLSTHLQAFNAASNIALRDVGAQLAIGFRKQPSIQEYLANRAKPRLNAIANVIAEMQIESASEASAESREAGAPAQETTR